MTTTYKYGADGLRTRKKVGSTTYDYYYADGRLVRQTWGTNYMDFLYDEKGNAYSFVYNGTQYYYVRNLQGDVVRILNTSGTTVVAYSYDAWGKCTVTTGASNAIANANPIRYRGYYYDTDTGFYYLQSRYYDPTVKRFINADDASLIGVSGDFISLNLYAYCLNNPVMCKDESGYAPEWLKWTLDIGLYVVSAAAAIGVGIAASTVASPIGGAALGVATFGALNNLTNIAYYNCISDGESDLTSISHATKHINRWDRLDYVKSQGDTPNIYTPEVRNYYAEYDVHVAGWRFFGWAYKKSLESFQLWLKKQTLLMLHLVKLIHACMYILLQKFLNFLDFENIKYIERANFDEKNSIIYFNYLHELGVNELLSRFRKKFVR